MNYTPLTGIARPLLLFYLGCLMLAAGLLVAAPGLAQAVSWQWQNVDNRERITIYLDAPGAAKVERTDRTAVTVTLPTPPQTVAQAPGSSNPASALVTKVSGQGQNLIIDLKAPAFGYITTLPNPRQVQIDFFADPLGARWKPKPGTETQNKTTPETPPATTQPAPQAQTTTPQSQTQNQTQNQTQAERQAETAASAPGGLREKDIVDAPPPSALDTLFNILTSEEPQTQDQATGEAAPPAQTQAQAQPPAQPQAQTPPETQAPAQAQGQATPPTQATPPVQTAPPAQTQAQSDAPAVASAVPPPVAAQAKPPVATSGQSSQPAQPATTSGDSTYAFVGAINPGGPEQWDSQANTLSANTAPVQTQTQAPVQAQPQSQATNSGTAPVAPPAAPQELSANATDSNAVTGQISPIAPLPEQAQPQAQVTPRNETSEALEEVAKNPPAMVSTTGQLAQAQTNISPLPEQSPSLDAAQNATQPVNKLSGQLSGQPQTQTPSATHTPNGSPAETPGATAAGEVFGTVQPQPDAPAQAHNATAEALHGAEQKEEAPPQLDEDGNPIPPPPDPDAMLAETAKILAGRDYQKALDNYNAILALPNLTNEQRETAMYGVSDAQFGLGQDNLAEHFAQITDSTERAMNFNLQSPRVPSLLMRLGFVNMKMDNVQEAEAYFNMLKRKYPEDSNVPLTYYYWGDYFFKHEDFRRASDQFQYIVQNYPDSRYVREASLGLARSLYTLGYYEQAYQVGEYIDRRWPRFYVEFPAVLTMFGDMATRLGKLDDARRYYWTYYNIDPTGNDADTSLVHLGDIYMQQDKPAAAKEIYQNAADSFPNKDGGLIAQMRLAEDGIHDVPLIPEMDALFDRGYNLRPMEVYNHIINDFPKSKLAPLATLKLAMWELWNKRYEQAIQGCEEFMGKYPKHDLLPNVQEVAMTSFGRLTADALPESNYGRILRAWENAPGLQALEERLSPQVRLSLSLSEVNQNKSLDALKSLDPFFRGAKDPEFGDSALILALSTLVDTQAWDQIEPLAARVSMWELKPETKSQLDYSRALAFENLGRSDQAMPLWEDLKNRGNLPLQLQAYTMYFLSRAALRNNDLQNAYTMSRQALQIMSDVAENDPSRADTAKIKSLLGSLLDITESAGRTSEALEWYQQYAQYVREGDEEWPSLRFRLAQLYKAAGDTERWSSLLKELAAKYPDTLYGKMAVSELETHKLRQNISDFMPATGQ